MTKAERFVKLAAFEQMVIEELGHAYEKHPDNSGSLHEAYAIILEELDEFWDEVKKQSGARDPKAMRTELVQIAAMAARAAIDCGLMEGE